MSSRARVFLFPLLWVVPGCTPGCGGSAASRPVVSRPPSMFAVGQRIELAQIPPQTDTAGMKRQVFPMGEIVELAAGDPITTTPPALPVLTVTQPANGATVKSDGEFPVVVRVVLPAGASLPTIVYLYMESRGKNWGSPNALPLGREPDGAYLYAARFNCPVYPGSAKLRARAIVDYVIGRARTDGKKPEVLTFDSVSPPVTLQVQ